MKCAQEFIDKYIKVDLDIKEYDANRVAKIMKKLSGMHGKYTTMEDRIQTAKLVWEFRSYAVKFPLLDRVEEALRARLPGKKLTRKVEKAKDFANPLENGSQRIEKNSFDFPSVEGAFRGKFYEYESFGGIYDGDNLLCGVNNVARYPCNVRGKEGSNGYYYFHTTDFSPSLNHVVPEYWIQFQGIQALSFANFVTCTKGWSSYGDVTSVNEIRAASMDIIPEYIIFESKEVLNKRKFETGPEYSVRDLQDIHCMYISLCNSGAFKTSSSYKQVEYGKMNDKDERVFRPLDADEIADSIVQQIEADEAERKRKEAEEAERKRLANLPLDGEEAVKIRHPWITKLEKIFVDKDGCTYYTVYIEDKTGMLCTNSHGQDLWKVLHDISYRAEKDEYVKYRIVNQKSR